MGRPEALGPGGITNFDGHVGYFLFVCGIGYIIAQRVGAITYNRECSSAGNGQSNFPGPCFKWIKNADVVVINPCKGLCALYTRLLAPYPLCKISLLSCHYLLFEPLFNLTLLDRLS